MAISTEDILNDIDRKQKEFQDNNYSTTELLKIITGLRLDWGYFENSLNTEFDIGSTKPVLLKGLSKEDSKLGKNEKLFQHSENAQLLINTFLIEKRLSRELLTRIHSHIIEDGGKYRRNKVVVDDQTSVLKTEFSNIDEIESNIEALVDWFNQEMVKKEMHPVLIGAIFHYKLVLIHPFSDGNGRLARIITSLILLSYNIPPPIIKDFDRYEYIASLRNADSGDIKPLLRFIGKRILFSFDIISSLIAKNNE